MTVAGLVDQAIRERFKTQVAMEAATGLHDSVVSRWRAGVSLPNKYLLPTLAKALDLPLAELEAVVTRERAARKAAAVRRCARQGAPLVSAASLLGPTHPTPASTAAAPAPAPEPLPRPSDGGTPRS